MEIILASHSLSAKVFLGLPETAKPRFPFPDSTGQRGRKDKRKYFFQKKGENSDSRTPQVLESGGPEQRESKAKVSSEASARKNMFSFYGFCKSIGF